MSTTKKEVAEISPYDKKFMIIFRLFSWWHSMDGRDFVIIQRWFAYSGELAFLDLAEHGNEVPIRVNYLEYFEQFKLGKLQCKSQTADGIGDSGWPPGKFYPERNC